MNVPQELLYTKEHEWVKIDGDIALMGITDHAQSALGDITFIDLPALNKRVTQFGLCTTVESVKAAGDVYAPLSGEIAAVNTQLTEHPELVNQSPYEQGWLVKIRVSDPGEQSALMSAADYCAYLKSLLS